MYIDLKHLKVQLRLVLCTFLMLDIRTYLPKAFVCEYKLHLCLHTMYVHPICVYNYWSEYTYTYCTYSTYVRK